MSMNESVVPFSEIEIRRGYEPGLIGRIGELHGRYYAAAWGAGAPFEAQITCEICDFVERYDPTRNLLLSAHLHGEIVGSIAILGQNPEPEGAQLRFFIVDPKYHGRGAGKALLSSALDWCRKRRFSKVFLWTVDNLPQSRHLYEKAGFRVVLREVDARYTLPLENLKMELSLSWP